LATSLNAAPELSECHERINTLQENTKRSCEAIISSPDTYSSYKIDSKQVNFDAKSALSTLLDESSSNKMQESLKKAPRIASSGDIPDYALPENYLNDSSEIVSKDVRDYLISI
jgi:hypothetical protein